VSKVNLLTAASNAATTNLVKDTKSSTNKRRQKSVGKERPNQQPVAVAGKQTVTDKPGSNAAREREASPNVPPA
jgi:hypothetical protein